MVTLPTAWGASSPSVSQQRADFLAAERALAKNHRAKFTALLRKLRHYPLYPHLIAADLSERLPHVEPTELWDFLHTFGGTVPAMELRAQWLNYLFSADRWGEFLAAYQPTNDTSMECRYRWALLQSGAPENAFNGLAYYWMTGRDANGVCNRLFATWRAVGGLSDALIWERLRNAIDQGALDFARHIAREYLDVETQAGVELWIHAYSQPRLVLEDPRLQSLPKIAPDIITLGLKRLARDDVYAAQSRWELLRAQFTFSPAQRADIRRTLATWLAVERDPDALTWLAALQPQEEDQATRERRVVIAIANEDWNSVLTWINWLSKEEQSSTRWRYWRARTLQELGFEREAHAIYRAIAHERDYYSFLAADRVGLPYHIHHKPLPYSAAELETFGRERSLLAAREWFALQRAAQGRREWQYATRQMNDTDLVKAARLAYNWGWYDRAIFTVARAPKQDDLEVLYPLLYRAHITAQAQTHDLNPAWVYGILRQESGFVTDARSPVGALGLMQIMPQTGQLIARRLKTRLKRSEQLLQPATNITFGTAYLRMVLNTHNNNAVLATAAYNAGSGRVKRWRPREGLAADVWIESIPYKETREYVKRVLTYTLVYDRRLGQGHLNLSALMPPIGEAEPTTDMVSLSQVESVSPTADENLEITAPTLE